MFWTLPSSARSTTSVFGHHQDWWSRERPFRVRECFAGFFGPLDFFSLSEQLVEWQCSLPNLLMKRLSAASLPVSYCTPLISVGSCILAIAWTFSGFASIPRAETIYPSSFPAGTTNTHFFGLSLILYLFSAAKVSRRSSSSVLAL